MIHGWDQPQMEVTLEDVAFLDNQGIWGGGLRVRFEQPQRRDHWYAVTLRRCVFRGNRCTEAGAGAYVDFGLPQAVDPPLHDVSYQITVEDCLFEDNVNTGARAGGLGIWMEDTGSQDARDGLSGRYTFRNNTFRHNEAQQWGAGLVANVLPGADPDSAVVLEGNTFEGNRLTPRGTEYAAGAAYHQGPPAAWVFRSTAPFGGDLHLRTVVEGNTFRDNVLDGNGKGGALYFGSDLNVDDGARYHHHPTTLSGNRFLGNAITGRGSGAGAYLVSPVVGESPLLVEDNEFSDNVVVGRSSDSIGGGLMVYYWVAAERHTATIRRNRFSDNRILGSGRGGGLFVTAIFGQRYFGSAPGTQHRLLTLTDNVFDANTVGPDGSGGAFHIVDLPALDVRGGESSFGVVLTGNHITGPEFPAGRVTSAYLAQVPSGTPDARFPAETWYLLAGNRFEGVPLRLSLYSPEARGAGVLARNLFTGSAELVRALPTCSFPRCLCPREDQCAVTLGVPHTIPLRVLGNTLVDPGFAALVNDSAVPVAASANWWGDALEDAALVVDSGRPILDGVTFSASPWFHVVNRSPHDLFARGSYWQTLDPAILELRILDGEDDAEAGRVLLEPVLAQPPTP